MKNIDKISKEVFSKSVADKDAAAAKKIKKNLLDAYQAIADAVKKINSTLSSFNAQGLKAAFFKGLKSGLSRDNFDRTKASKYLGEYYDGYDK